MSLIRILAVGLVLSICIRNAGAQAPTPLPEKNWPAFEDLADLRQIEEMAVSADGDWVAYVVAPVFEQGQSSTTGTIKLVRLRSSGTRVLKAPYRAGNLKWSPRGQTLAFQVKTGKRTEIWQYAPGLAAPQARPLVSADSLGGEILDYSWSPAGNAIAYLAVEPEPPRSRSDSLYRNRLVLFEDTPGNITGPTTRVWERDSSGAYVAIAPLDGQAPRVVSRRVISWKGDPEIQWLRTGELGLVGVPVEASLDQLFFERSVTIIDPRSGLSRPLVLRDGDAPRLPAWSPSGRHLAYHHLDRPTDDPHRPLGVYRVRVVDLSVGTSERSLSQEADGLRYPLGPLWSADERTIYIGRYERGTSRLFAIDLKTKGWRVLTPDTLSVAHYSLANDGKHLLVVLENANQPGELYRLEPGSGALTRLTQEGATLFGLPLGRVDPVHWTSADRRFTVHGFLLKPAVYNPKRRYPLIVMVHGGPGDFYANEFIRLRFDSRLPPPQMLGAAGYLVLLPNPRGDASYGVEFQAALNGDLAQGPFQDIDSGVSALIARGLVDSSSIGIFGVSYGAYLSSYAITQTNRYAAAGIDDGPINLTSLFGQEYAFGVMFLRERLRGTPWSRPQAYAAQSPITFVHQVRTPVLMRYGGRSASAADAIRLSFLAQGLEFYAGLKESNVPVEFIVHPDQGHGIADWPLYSDWTRRTLAWFRRWLQK